MSKALRRLKNILSAIDDIDFIINSKINKTTKSIEDKIIKPAIRMNIIRISEEFKKLKEQKSKPPTLLINLSLKINYVIITILIKKRSGYACSIGYKK